ncbi:cation transporter [Paenibacillus sp. J31TS4]|uniref:cation diffusion facilitator family transporter n=1 Tax=Paenibacillus sp. J31TS4 TaxID=2807195 RepID=UPI001B1C91F6|nr:cation diffusion facilitator family transporter [Paenibacillus sp. J31TS4]GIP39233.1 cation transporter [Paenibacillus sp. J31TS4]
MARQRRKKTDNAVWAAIAGSLLLSVFKGWVGYTADATSLMADAVHTASLALAGLTIWVQARVDASPSPAPRKARRKAMAAASAIAAALLLVVGVELAVASLRIVQGGVGHAPAWYAAPVLVLTLAAGVLLTAWRLRNADGRRDTGSHWGLRSHLSSALVAFVGTAGALLGQWFQEPVFYYLDPLAGFLISLLIARLAYRLLTEFRSLPSDEALDEEDREDLIRAAQRVRGVISVDDLSWRENGPYFVVDIRISVNPRITVLEGHAIAKSVQHQLMKRFSHLSDVHVFVIPYDGGYPYKRELEEDQEHQPTLLH